MPFFFLPVPAVEATRFKPLNLRTGGEYSIKAPPKLANLKKNFDLVKKRVSNKVKYVYWNLILLLFVIFLIPVPQVVTAGQRPLVLGC